MQLKSIRLAAYLSVVAVLSVGCLTYERATVSTTQQPVTSVPQGELVHASVSLAAELDGDDTKVPLLVTYSGCSGGLVPQEIESVVVDETHQSVSIEMLVRLPVEPFPTTCPDNPTIEHTVALELPLGGRSVAVEYEDQTITLWPSDS